MATRRVNVPSRQAREARWRFHSRAAQMMLRHGHPARLRHLTSNAKRERWERMRKIARGAFDRIVHLLAIYPRAHDDVPVITSGAHSVSELRAALYAEAHQRLQSGDTMTIEPCAQLCALRVTVVRSTFAPQGPSWLGGRDDNGYPEEWRN